MIVCLVTDRRRLVAALGLAQGDWRDALRAQATAAGKAGVDLLQVREPDLDAGELTGLVRELVSATRSFMTRVVVNDRLDIAVAGGAAGVHLRERSFSCVAARRLSPPGFIVGRSIHGQTPAAAFEQADYLIAGTMFPTVSKPGADCLGPQGMATIVQVAGGRPVLAIGGIDEHSITTVAASGVSGIAGIGVFVPGGGQPFDEFVQKRVSALRLGFDSAGHVS